MYFEDEIIDERNIIKVQTSLGECTHYQESVVGNVHIFTELIHFRLTEHFFVKEASFFTDNTPTQQYITYITSRADHYFFFLFLMAYFIFI